MKTNWLDRTLIMGPYLTLVTSEKQFASALKSLKVKRKACGTWIGESADATAHWLTASNGKLSCIVAIRIVTTQKKLCVYSLLVHEAVHVWQSFKEHIGEAQPSAEFEAYSIQNIAQALMFAYANQVKKGRNVKAKTTA